MPLDERGDGRPGQSAEAAAKSGNGDGADPGRAPAAGGQVGETDRDVLDAGSIAPVALGGEMDNVDRIARLPLRELVDHDAPRAEAAGAAGGAVGSKDLGVSSGEREGEASAHDPDAVDGIDERFGLRGEQISMAAND